MKRNTKLYVAAFVFGLTSPFLPYGCCLCVWWQIEEPWVLQTFNLDPYELRILGTTDILGDHPPGLTVELRNGGRPVGEPTQIGALDHERTRRFEASRRGTEGVIIVTERCRPHVVWFVYDPSTHQCWPETGYGDVRERLLTLVRRYRGDECVFCDSVN